MSDAEQQPAEQQPAEQQPAEQPAEKPLKACAMCGKPRPRYKCSACAAPYCCVGCSRAHKAKCAGPALRRPEQDEEGENGGGNFGGDAKRQRDEPSTVGGRRDGAAAAEAAAEEDLQVLTSAHLASLKDNRGVRAALRSGELRTLIGVIDSSRSRLEALAAARHNVPEFDNFCQQVLRAVQS
jgi:hypothetical protein